MTPGRRRIGFWGIIVVASATLSLGGMTVRTGAAAAQDPEGFVQSVGDDVVHVLQQKLPEGESEQKLGAIWKSAFDVPAFGRAAMGTHWNAATETQRQSYLDVFAKYVVRVYATQFAMYSGQTFKVVRSAPLSNGGATMVRTQIVGSGDPINVDFVVSGTSGTMKIRDVRVEGVSILIEKRAEFDSVIAQKGIDGLIEALRQKVT